MMKHYNLPTIFTRFFLLSGVLGLFLTACNNESGYVPKPRGYFRIDLPIKQYSTYNKDLPYVFDLPVYAEMVNDSSRRSEPQWRNMLFPQFRARLHLSYKRLSGKKMLNELIEDAHTFAFKHTIKAQAIDEAAISDPKRKMYGVYYIIDGNTASWIQFYLTDSTNHYLRGALYFWDEPRLDSIKPVLDFLKQDVNVFIKTVKWKK